MYSDIGQFEDLFIQKNINFKRDTDNHLVQAFKETKKLRETALSIHENDIDDTYDYDDMNKQTKALYLLIREQISRENHPISIINREFSRVF